MERKPANELQTHSHQDLPGYEQKPHRGRRIQMSRLVTAKSNRKYGSEVDAELGQGKITCLREKHNHPKASLIWGGFRVYP